MKCPICVNVELVIAERQGVEIDCHPIPNTHHDFLVDAKEA